FRKAWRDFASIREVVFLWFRLRHVMGRQSRRSPESLCRAVQLEVHRSSGRKRDLQPGGCLYTFVLHLPQLKNTSRRARYCRASHPSAHRLLRWQGRTYRRLPIATLAASYWHLCLTGVDGLGASRCLPPVEVNPKSESAK